MIVELDIDELDFFRSAGCETKKGSLCIDPLFRFSNPYLDLIQSYPKECGCDDADDIQGILARFGNEDEFEYHAFFVSNKGVEHYELSNSIQEQVLDYFIIDIFKRFNKKFLLSDVTTTTFSVDKEKHDEIGLLKLITSFRVAGKSLNLILKKLKTRGIDNLVSDFKNRGLDSWTAPTKKRRR